MGSGAMAAPAAGDDTAVRLDRVLDRWLAERKIVGMVVLVARDGELVYRRAAGYADREAGSAMREDAIFRLASMTKLIVSTTALALADAAILSLDDAVCRWLPYFTPALASGRRPLITVRHLLTHTAGLSYSFFEPEDNAYRREHIAQGLDAAGGTLEDNLRRLATVPLFYEPGTEWRYSLATDVLGAVVEAAARMPLAEAVQRAVTGPLDMSDTAFGVVDPDRLTAAYVDGPEGAVRMHPRYQRLPLGAGVMIAPDRVLDTSAYPSGGGGMTGTAIDYLTLLEALRQGGRPVLGEASAAAVARHTVGGLRAWTEGPGWGFSMANAVLLDAAAAATPQSPGTWQWGGALGAHFFVDPARRLSVVVMTNTAVAGVIGAFPTAVRDAVYGTVDGPRGRFRT